MKNVLQYVQSCLSTMDSDMVDEIEDTAESMQVAELLSDTYYELLNRQEWSFLKGPVQLQAAADPLLPTKFTLPTTLRRLLNLWYNTDESGALNRRELTYLEPEDFLARSGGEQTGKQLITLGSQIQFYVWTDRMPTYFTSFDGDTIHCDAFKSSVESTLVQAKLSAFGVSVPDFTVSNTFIPEIPEHMVPLLQASLNAAAHIYFKQQVSAVDEQRQRRQLAQARHRESKITRDRYYSYGFGRR